MASPQLIQRIESATPPGRDRAVDALRALAILGVVLGHWLVTAVVVGDDGTVRVASPALSRVSAGYQRRLTAVTRVPVPAARAPESG
ncbi:acyltransferase [Nonomuraea sp. NEAU-A123]|uniref:acyltransferase n=1 Tax=Nonomuraea sp. NEAU-A123 TaxID=2839649 RepID=UPI001BE3FD99|nr:acyltransferase [Nonomuraea sp. NEAU-A123]MBT2225298.1 acyltransferase [Nonomuraea sp. NEAU-A123]